MKIYLKTPNNIEIQNFETQKNDPSLHIYENIRVHPRGIMGNIHVKLQMYMELGPVVQEEMLFEEKVYARADDGGTDDRRRLITIPRLEHSACIRLR